MKGPKMSVCQYERTWPVYARFDVMFKWQYNFLVIFYFSLIFLTNYDGLNRLDWILLGKEWP